MKKKIQKNPNRILNIHFFREYLLIKVLCAVFFFIHLYPAHVHFSLTVRVYIYIYIVHSYMYVYNIQFLLSRFFVIFFFFLFFHLWSAISFVRILFLFCCCCCCYCCCSYSCCWLFAVNILNKINTELTQRLNVCIHKRDRERELEKKRGPQTRI